MRVLSTLLPALLVVLLAACGSNPGESVATGPDGSADASSESDTADETTDVPAVEEVEVDLVDPLPDADPDPADIEADAADIDADDADADVDVPEADADAPDAPPPTEEDCTNGIDDDGDGAIDDADADCEDVRACSIPPYGCEGGDWSCNVGGGTGPDCANGLDDDGDGTTDCEDPDCALDPPCRPLPCLPGECAADETCDRHTGECVSSVSPPSTGAEIGEACEVDSDCRTDGHVRGTPWGGMCEAGWPGGYCMGGCSLCEDSWDGEQLPRRECPTGAVCLPADQFSQPGTGACVQECQSDEDCRTDDEWDPYFCRRSFFVIGEWREYTNGYCAPPHCSSRGCTGFVCGC